MVIKGVEPNPKGRDQLVVGVAEEDEKRLEHELPSCFGVAAMGLEIGSAGGLKGVGLSLAVPHFWQDVGSCFIAQVRQMSDSHMQLDLIEELVTGQLPLLSHHDLVDGQIRGPPLRNGGQRAFQ